MWRFAILVVAACGRFGFGDGSAHDASKPIDPDLIAWYPMDSLGTGAQLIDASGHGHQAQCAACPNLVAGRHGNALDFDGADFFAVPYMPELDLTTGFTIAVWLEVMAAPTGIRGHFMTKAFGGNSLDSYAMTVETDQTLSMFTTGGGVPDQVRGVTTIPLGTWLHVAGRWDGLRAQVLMNGAIVADRALTAIDWDSSTVNVGGDFENGSPTAFYTGKLDDLRIYRRALSDAEIVGIMSGE